MAKNKKPSKKYKPRPRIQDPVSFVIGGFKPVNAGIAVNVKTINHSSMLALVQGRGTKVDWDYVCTALNISLALAHEGIGAEYLHSIDAAMAAHAACGKRQVSHGVFGYTGEQLTAVNLALEIHDAQIDIARVAEMETAHVAVRKAILTKKFKYQVKELA